MAIEIYTDGSAKGNPGKGGMDIVIKKMIITLKCQKDSD